MLSNKALLVSMNIYQWTGKKLDRRATGAVEGEFKTHAKVGQYVKKLLPGAKELETVQTLASQNRTFFYANTLPWLADGSRILSSKNYMDFMRDFAKRKAAYYKAVNEFLYVYPGLKASARAKLGDLYNEGEYPTAETLKESFQCELTVMPMPEVGDFRTEVLDSEKETFLAKMREVETNATRECFDRLQNVVRRAAEKLNKPDAFFRDSLLTSISSICEILPKLNITDDPQLEATRREVETLVSSLDPQNCRTNLDDRQIAARKLQAISDKMSVFMGGN